MFEAAVCGTGYVEFYLHAVLRAAWGTSTFRYALLVASNLGWDADTTAAVEELIAGALCGARAIPSE
ncbi:ADP-ribosylglycohydrolase family protein [Methylobacterium sp. D48H]